jgi:chromosome segregation ATPase
VFFFLLTFLLVWVSISISGNRQMKRKATLERRNFMPEEDLGVRLNELGTRAGRATKAGKTPNDAFTVITNHDFTQKGFDETTELKDALNAARAEAEHNLTELCRYRELLKVQKETTASLQQQLDSTTAELEKVRTAMQEQYRLITSLRALITELESQTPSVYDI